MPTAASERACARRAVSQSCAAEGGAASDGGAKRRPPVLQRLRRRLSEVRRQKHEAAKPMLTRFVGAKHGRTPFFLWSGVGSNRDLFRGRYNGLTDRVQWFHKTLEGAGCLDEIDRGIWN